MRLRRSGRTDQDPASEHSPQDDGGTGATARTDPASPHAEHVPDATRAPAPTVGRGDRLMSATRRVAIVAVQFLVIVVAAVALLWLLGRLWVILLPIVLGLLVTTVLWPPVRFLRAHRWPPALAAATVMVVFVGFLAGIVALIAPSITEQVSELADAATAGLADIRIWLTGPPFNLGEDQIGQAVDSAIASLQGNAQNIAGYGLTAASAIGNGIITFLLALLLTFFFLKDGPRWVPWLAAQTGPNAAPHVVALSSKSWSTLSEFIRQQAIVGFVDALFIAIGLLILDVPLVLPLAVLTFFGAFIPIVGAFVAGGFAVLIALVDQGFGAALIVLAIVIGVQQLEGNVLQPILQGRGLNLHPAVVILAVTAGATIFGIVGALLAVPVAALIAVFYRYGRDVLDGRDPEVDAAGRTAQVSGGEEGARVVREPDAEEQTAADEPTAAPGDAPAAATRGDTPR